MASKVVGLVTGYLANASMQFGVTPIATKVISGSGSLEMHRNATTGRYVNVIRNVAPTAMDDGVLTTILRVNTFTSGDVAGLGFMFSQADLTGGAGSAYVAGVLVGSSPNITPVLYKYTSTGLAATPTTLASGASKALTTPFDVAIAVRWVNSDDLGGVWIRAWIIPGQAHANYSLLNPDTPTLEVVNSSSPLTTTVGEGEVMRLISTSSAGVFIFDETTRIPSSVGIL